MVEVQIVVPTLDGLSTEFSVEIEEPQFPDGSVIERDFTAIFGGYPGSPQELLGFVFPNTDERVDRESSADPAEVYPGLKQAVETAYATQVVSSKE